MARDRTSFGCLRNRPWQAAAVCACAAAAAVATGASGAAGGRIRIITTIAGGGTAAIRDDVAATSVKLYVPEGVAVDGAGNTYVADSAQQRVFKIRPSGTITTFAGGGAQTGDGGPATSARLKAPSGVATDTKGNVYISDFVDNRVRKVDSRGRITTIAGTGEQGYSGDGRPATHAKLRDPRGVAVDTKGNVYIVDLLNQRVRKVGVDGIITTFAGGGSSYENGGRAISSQLNSPHSVAVDRKGNVYIASDTVVSRVNPRGTITAFWSPPFPAVEGPYGVAVDRKGSVYISDTDNNRILKVSRSGTLSKIAGTGRLGFSGDGGPAAKARLYGPEGLAVTDQGAVFVADTFNRRVRKVEP